MGYENIPSKKQSVEWKHSTTPDESLDMMSETSNSIGEFDPGSGRTLAACLIHASRAQEAGGSLRGEAGGMSGGRVSNTWATYLVDWDNSGKPGLIPDDHLDRMIRM